MRLKKVNDHLEYEVGNISVQLQLERDKAMLNEEIQKAYTKYGHLETQMKYITLGMIMTDLHKETKLDLLEGIQKASIDYARLHKKYAQLKGIGKTVQGYING